MRLIFLFIALLLLGACTTYTTTCQLSYLSFRFVGFDTTDLDTVLLKTYYNTTNRPAQDSVLITYAAHTAGYHFNGDTTTIPLAFTGDTFERELIIPALSRRVRITEIVSDPPYSSTAKYPFFMSAKMDECWRKILSYKADGVQVTVPQGSDAGPVTIIK